VSPHERNLEPHISRALQELLAGREPQPDDVTILTGEAKACIDALVGALHTDGVQAVRKAFSALVKDRSWLSKLASQGPAEVGQDEQKPRRRIRFLPDSAFENRPPRQWLIPTMLPKAGIAMVFGPPGCGKSFLAMAWSLCIASGTQWLGRPVLQGPVAYIAGEGSFGLGPRIRAWKSHHGFQGDSGVQWYDQSIILQDASQVSELLTAFSEDFPLPPVLVVIDTLSRCSGGADENSNTEMTRVIAAADVLQQQYHCTVLIVHHAGKDRDKGPRGASSLTGNTETIIEVVATTEGCRVVCFKQKDAPKFDSLSLKLQQVQYGLGEDDTSAVLVLGNPNAQPVMNKSEAVMYAALRGKKLSYSDWVAAGMGNDAEKVISKTSAETAIKKLVDSGRVQKDGRVYFHTAREEGDGDTTNEL
jgi:AAA domain